MDRSWSTPRPSHMNFKGPEHGPAGPAGRLERPLAGHAQIAPHCGCDGGVCDPSPTFATVGCEPSPFSECCSFDPFDCAVRHIARARPGLLGRRQTAGHVPVVICTRGRGWETGTRQGEGVGIQITLGLQPRGRARAQRMWERVDG